MHQNYEFICKKFWLCYECDINWICRTYEDIQQEKMPSKQDKSLAFGLHKNKQWKNDFPSVFRLKWWTTSFFLSLFIAW